MSLAVDPLCGGVFELNSAKGLWQLDDSLDARWSCQAPLSAQGFAIGTTPGPHFEPATPPQSWLSLGSATAPFAGLKPNEWFALPNPAGPNGAAGATGTHNWTLVMDVRFLTLPTWTSVMQSSPTNGDDGEIFLFGDGALYFLGANSFGPATNPLALNTWHRLAFRASYNAEAGVQILRAFVNGVPTTQTAGNAIQAPFNGRYSLPSEVLLFTDDNNETARVDVGSVAFWGQALADTDLATIGAYDGNGIDWPDITPADSCPPLPQLTGNLLFGGFTANYSPNLPAITATATAPTLAGAVATVQINLGSSGGSIPGMPNHHFGGILTGHVMPDGNVVVLNTVAVTHTGGGPDLGTLADVSFARSEITLGPTGATAGSLRVYLPAGFGVALEPLGKRVLVRATKAGVPLDSTLSPASTLALSRADFTSDLSSTLLYPMVDRVPVRFAANSLNYAPAAGRFTFTATEDLLYHRQVQLAILLGQIAAGQPGAVVPASNEFYFISAKTSSGPVRISARPNGAAAIASMTITLDPQKFGGSSSTVWMHYPLAPVTWSVTAGSELRFLNDLVDLPNSRLVGADLSGCWYSQGVPSIDCKGTPGTSAPPVGTAYIQPAADEWRFTPDGGLRAAGAVQAGATDTSPLTVEWCAYQEGATQYYAHGITTGFTTGRILGAGIWARADSLAGLTPPEQPFALLFSGHGSPANESIAERPGTAAYFDGLADYPGINLRCTGGGYQAVSRLAGKPVPPYPLAAEAKYCLRPAGVTGRHLVEDEAPAIQFDAFGADFNVTGLNLAFLDGVNVASGVAGSLDVPLPADFDLTFKTLMFGGQGQLKEAAVFTPQADKVLGLAYWGLEFTPLALEFPQPKVCPPPGPSVGFVKVMAKATLSGLGNQPMVGNLSVLDGNLVVESDPEAVGNGPVSQFAPGAQLIVKGPDGGGDWIVHPVTGVLVNKHPSTPSGVLTVGGLMDVPFFVDMPVTLSTNSTNQLTDPPDVYVRKPWAALESTPYDPGHLGIPPGVALPTYRTAAAWDPHATRKWQELIEFDFPLVLDANRVFQSRTPVEGDVILFHLTQAVKSMTPAAAEITFDGSAALDMGSLIPQVNVAALLQDSGLLSLPAVQQAALEGALDAVAGLDSLLADQLQDLLKPGLALAAGHRVDAAFFAALANSTDRGAKLNELTPGLTADVASLLGGGSSGPTGKWRRDFLAEVSKARQGMQDAEALVSSASSLQVLASAIGSKFGLGGSPTAPEPNQFDALKSLFAQVVTRLQAVENELSVSGDLTTSLNTALGFAPAITAIVQQAVDDLKAKWAPDNANAGGALYAASTASKLAADLAASLTDRFAGAEFAGSATQLFRQYASDPQTLARQAIDDTLRIAEQLIAAGLNDTAPIVHALGTAAPGELPLGEFLASAGLRGYARIDGDALHELRLDGQLRLQVPDEMKFDAWFLLRDIDSTTPGGACLAAGGAKAEIGMGASGSFEWAGKQSALSASGKVAVAAGGMPVAFSGDLALLGSFDFSEVKVSDVKLGFGFGANNGYCYGRAAGKVRSMSVEAGIFVGQTCDTEVIANADEDIGGLLNQVLPGFALPVRGAMVYAEGGMSLMPLIGVPPSCVLDLRVHGGQGYFGFFNSSSQVVAGVKNLQGVSGELLCLVDVSGKFASVLAASGSVAGGSPEISSLNGSAAAKMKGTVGVDPFSYTFTKTIHLKVKAAPLKWGLDY